MAGTKRGFLMQSNAHNQRGVFRELWRHPGQPQTVIALVERLCLPYMHVYIACRRLEAKGAIVRCEPASARAHLKFVYQQPPIRRDRFEDST